MTELTQDIRASLPISKTLSDLILKEIANGKQTETAHAVTINFRDPDYSPDNGGYHPVETRIALPSHRVEYITDFAYTGIGYCAELEKSLDFDFSQNTFQQMGLCYPISEAEEMFDIWQINFCQFYEMGVYKVQVHFE